MQGLCCATHVCISWCMSPICVHVCHASGACHQDGMTIQASVLADQEQTAEMGSGYHYFRSRRVWPSSGGYSVFQLQAGSLGAP